jgi:hypothetical protein
MDTNSTKTTQRKNEILLDEAANTYGDKRAFIGIRDMDGDGDIDVLDFIATIAQSRLVRVSVQLVLPFLYTLAVVGAGIMLAFLSIDHLRVGYVASIASSVAIAGMFLVIPFLILGTTKETTRALLKAWYGVFFVVAASGCFLYALLIADTVVLPIDELANIGKIVTPMTAVIVAFAVGTVFVTARGEDKADAGAGLFQRVATIMVFLFSSYGILNVAMQAQNIATQAFGVSLAVVVEITLLALVHRKQRTAALDVMTYGLGTIVGANLVETVSFGLGFQLPGWLSYLPIVGQTSLLLSGAFVVLAVILLNREGYVYDRPSLDVPARFSLRIPRINLPRFGAPTPSAPSIDATSPVASFSPNAEPAHVLRQQPDARPVLQSQTEDAAPGK